MGKVKATAGALLCLLVAAPCAFSQPALNSGERIWIEPNTPIGEALGRGILYSPLESAFVLTGFNTLLHQLPRLPSAVAISNGGVDAEGKIIAGLSANLNDPLGIGDRLELKGGLTEEPGNNHLSLGYSVLLGGAGTRVSAYYSRTEEKLGNNLAALQAHGESSALSLIVRHPLSRGAHSNWFVFGGFQHAEEEDRIDAIPIRTDAEVNAWFAGITGEARDGFFGGGLNAVTLDLRQGELDLDPLSQAADQGAGGRRTAGTFRVASFELRRLQRLSDPLSLFLRGEGQWASKNLGAGGIGIGGPNKVRAYPGGESGGDEGYFFSAEFRYLISGFRPFGSRTALTAFYDWGHVRFHKDPLPTDVPNDRTLAGYGVGAFIGRQADFHLRASLAWRSWGGPAQAPDGDRKPRAWVQMAKWF
jgi:hemolysin activation/secretion protein